MDTNTVHKFTFCQFVCLVILYALKSVKAVAVVFPFFLLFIAVFRHFFIPKMFAEDDLRVLDPPGGEIVAADAAGGGAKGSSDGAEKPADKDLVLL